MQLKDIEIMLLRTFDFLQNKRKKAHRVTDESTLETYRKVERNLSATGSCEDCETSSTGSKLVYLIFFWFNIFLSTLTVDRIPFYFYSTGICSEERSIMVRGWNALRRELNGFYIHAIELFHIK